MKDVSSMTPLQASVCRAYQIFKSHGIPDENIVVMMFDDIAYNFR